MPLADRTHETAAAVERYIEDHLFDPSGLMYSGIDSWTNQPFERSFITPNKLPRRAEIDPWAYWTYEDSMMAFGLYIDALVLKHGVTGDEAAIDRATALWQTVRKVYAASQVFGVGSFHRPYGGFVTMAKFVEPLGTDQASPLFAGLYRLLPHLDARSQSQLVDIMLRTLTWYEQQGFSYFYYRFLIHEYHPDNPLGKHPTSYYLPAVSWAATVSDDPKWARYRDERLPILGSKRHNIYDCFLWGSDLILLRDLLGDDFDRVFTGDVLDAGWERCQASLSQYEGEAMLKRAHAESAQPGFAPHVRDNFKREEGMGFAYFHAVHGGRSRPRHEQHFLGALATLGYPGALDQFCRIVDLRHRVPRDFTAFLAEEYDTFPEEAHLYARSVGISMVGWLRDYWRARVIG